MDISSLLNAISASSLQERKRYHATFGDLIDKLDAADASARISPVIKGISAYRGYYSDIALCTDEGQYAYKTVREDFAADDWYEKNEIKIDLAQTPKELAAVLKSLLGAYFDGYKGGWNEITREKPLWIARDYGDSSQIAVVGISDSLELITKTIEI